MSKLVKRVLGEAEAVSVEPHNFILDSPARPEIEVRYEQVFATVFGLKTARCHSRFDGRFLKMKIQFDRDERPSLGLGDFHYILRDIPKEFYYRIVRRSVVMVTIRGAATLTFLLEPDI